MGVILTVNLFSLNLLAVDTDGSDSSLIVQRLNDRAVSPVELTLPGFYVSLGNSVFFYFVNSICRMQSSIESNSGLHPS